jgi:predicted nuclease of predicted toxin-antitoxin system
MRILADSNIQRSTVLELRSNEHDVVWVMERDIDPGDRAILNEAVRTRRVVITADKGFGRLVVMEKRPHAGLILLDETPAIGVQADLVRRCIERYANDLAEAVFIRVTADGRMRRQKPR